MDSWWSKDNYVLVLNLLLNFLTRKKVFVLNTLLELSPAANTSHERGFFSSSKMEE